LQSELLLSPHHGSKTSSSSDFIKLVNPKIAFISVGRNNIYNLPNDKIIHRYNQHGIKIYRTDSHGGIRLKIANDQINIETVRNL